MHFKNTFDKAEAMSLFLLKIKITSFYVICLKYKQENYKTISIKLYFL
jgi:hypothetical protein